MRVCQFNFNNEVDTITIHIEEDGRVSVPGENNQILATYNSVQQLAEMYALARDVKNENLKNWTLLQHGDAYSFVLRAGTAGVYVSDVEDQLENVFASLAGEYHALNIARAKEQIMADSAVDLVDALVHCSETAVANAVYDAMEAVITGTEGETAEAEDEVEVDTRTEMEKYIDEMEETVPGSIKFFAALIGLPADTEKEAVTAAFSESIAFSNVRTLKAVFDNAINDTMNEGIGVNTRLDALTVMTQTAIGSVDNEAKSRIMTSARMAKRNSLNISVDIVGAQHIRHTAEIIPLENLETADLLMRDNIPYIVRFSDTIDAELEAERDAAAQAEDYEAAQAEDYEAEYEEEYDDEEEY